MDIRENQAPADPGGESRLRNKMVGGTVVGIFCLLVLCAGFAFFAGRSALIDDGLETLDTVASIQEARVSSFLEAGRSNVDLITSHDQLRSNLSVYRATGSEESVEGMRRIVSAAVDASEGVEAIQILNPDGERVVGFLDMTAAIELPESYVEDALDSVVSGLVVETPDNQPVHLLAGPIDLDGRAIGIAVVAQSMGPLYRLVDDYTGLGQTGETMLVQQTEDGPQYIAPLRHNRVTPLRPISETIDALPIENAPSGTEMEVTNGVDYRGVEVLVVTRHVEQTGWGLLVKQDRSEVLAPLDTFLLLALGLLATALVAAYFLAARTADSVLGPVRQLTKTARAIAGGRRDLKVASTRNDEIGELARAFDAVTGQLNTLTSELEERVQKRTRELREKNAALARVMQDKETFLAGVSHEVRSPLTAMIGFLDLVNDAGDSLGSDERAEMLETVSRQADDVLNLIEDLLASARVEAGTLKVASVRCDLAAQIRQVVESIEHNTRIDIQLVGNGAIADADPSRVRQIIRNLLTNADRYGGGRVVVETDRMNGIAAIQVRDDGNGVPEQDRQQIFEPYGQSANQRVDGSVGLGLHVSRELARLMGGDLAYDYVDGWSVFMLFLPEHYDEPPVESGTEAVGLMSG